MPYPLQNTYSHVTISSMLGSVNSVVLLKPLLFCTSLEKVFKSPIKSESLSSFLSPHPWMSRCAPSPYEPLLFSSFPLLCLRIAPARHKRGKKTCAPAHHAGTPRRVLPQHLGIIIMNSVFKFGIVLTCADYHAKLSSSTPNLTEIRSNQQGKEILLVGARIRLFPR